MNRICQRFEHPQNVLPSLQKKPAVERFFIGLRKTDEVRIYWQTIKDYFFILELTKP